MEILAGCDDHNRSTSQASVVYGTPVTFTATVTAASGTAAPSQGSVDFFDTTTSHRSGSRHLRQQQRAPTPPGPSRPACQDLQRHHRGHHHRQLYARTGFGGSTGTRPDRHGAGDHRHRGRRHQGLRRHNGLDGHAHDHPGSLVSGDTATWTETFDTRNAGTGKTLTAAGSSTTATAAMTTR